MFCLFSDYVYEFAETYKHAFNLPVAKITSKQEINCSTMEDVNIKAGVNEEDGLYTEDGTIDIHKNPANKKKTGNWKACRFILGIKFLVLYLS